MIYVIIVMSIVVMLIAGLFADGAATARSIGRQTIATRVRPLRANIAPVVGSYVASAVQSQLSSTNRTSLDGLWTPGATYVQPPAVPLCNDPNDSTCRLQFSVTAYYDGCSGSAGGGNGNDAVQSENINSKAYVADEQRCGMSAYYAVIDPNAGATAVNGVYVNGGPGVYYINEYRMTFRIFAASPYAVLVGANTQRDFNRDIGSGVSADISGTGSADATTPYDPSNPQQYTDTMVHAVIGEKHRSGPGCDEGLPWGVSGNGIELDGGCYDSQPAPNPLPNGPFDFPANDTWNSAKSSGAW